MSQEQAPRLSHVGLYVTDVPKMTDFYTKVLGFVVSDKAEDGRITFMSRNPSDHHQVVLVRGRAADATKPMVQQLSFNVGTLANVKRAFRKVRAAACKVVEPRCHGNAWSVYFSDPEGNRIEMFCDTPWYVPQPRGFEIDLDKSEDELYRETEAICRASPGFKPIEEWRAEISQKIAAQLEYTDEPNASAPDSRASSAGEQAVTGLKGYHAHVYYDAATRPVAERLRDTIAGKFSVELGAFSDEPRGPHPISQFNVIFEAPEFHKIVPWLMLNRDGLDVLVHPLTESSYDDHSKNALWLGTPVPMRLDVLRPTYSETLLPTTQRA